MKLRHIALSLLLTLPVIDATVAFAQAPPLHTASPKHGHAHNASVGHLTRPGAHAAKLTRRGMSNAAWRAERRRRLAHLQAPDHEHGGLHPHVALIGLVGLALAALGIRQVMERRRTAAQERAAGMVPTYQPRAILLNDKSYDPQTYGETVVEQLGVPGTTPLGPEAFRDPNGSIPTMPLPENLASPPSAANPLPDAALDLSLKGKAEHAHVAAEIDRLVGSHSGSRESAESASNGAAEAAPGEPVLRLSGKKVRLASPEPAEPMRLAAAPAQRQPEKPPQQLPPALADHFAPLQGERLAWIGMFHLPLVCDGTVALTNRRLLAVYERRKPKLFPPQLELQVRRHQTWLNAISTCETVRRGRPSFLIAGLVLFLWYPFGTLTACLMLGLYFGLPRSALAITAAGIRRFYYLNPSDQDAMSRILSQLQAQSAPVNQAPFGPRKQAS